MSHADRRRQDPRPRRAAWALVATVLAAALLVFGLFSVGLYAGAILGLLPGHPSGGPGGESGDGPGSAAPGPGPGASVSPAVTTEHTDLVFILAYGECGCVQRESRLAGLELAGLDQAGLGEAFPGWQMQSFSPVQAQFYQLVDDLCPDMARYRTLGLREGQIAVFYGRPGTGLILQRLVPVAPGDLSAEDRDRLANGVVLDGEAAVERFLEGLPD